MKRLLKDGSLGAHSRRSIGAGPPCSWPYECLRRSAGVGPEGVWDGTPCWPPRPALTDACWPDHREDLLRPPLTHLSPGRASQPPGAGVVGAEGGTTTLGRRHIHSGEAAGCSAGVSSRGPGQCSSWRQVQQGEGQGCTEWSLGASSPPLPGLHCPWPRDPTLPGLHCPWLWHLPPSAVYTGGWEAGLSPAQLMAHVPSAATCSHSPQLCNLGTALAGGWEPGRPAGGSQGHGVGIWVMALPESGGWRVGTEISGGGFRCPEPGWGRGGRAVGLVGSWSRHIP